MKQLYLMRHAHAESSVLGFSDFDRPLTKEGRKEGKSVAKYLSQRNISFDFVMCSAARRAQETLDPLRAVVGTTDIDISENFYNIPEDKIFEYIKNIQDDKNKVLYIGHNPGVAFSILKFATSAPSFLVEGITPATLVGFQFSINKWMNLEWNTGEIINLFQPNLTETRVHEPQEP